MCLCHDSAILHRLHRLHVVLGHGLCLVGGVVLCADTAIPRRRKTAAIERVHKARQDLDLLAKSADAHVATSNSKSPHSAREYHIRAKAKQLGIWLDPAKRTTASDRRRTHPPHPDPDALAAYRSDHWEADDGLGSMAFTAHPPHPQHPPHPSHSSHLGGVGGGHARGRPINAISINRLTGLGDATGRMAVDDVEARIQSDPRGPNQVPLPSAPPPSLALSSLPWLARPRTIHPKPQALNPKPKTLKRFSGTGANCLECGALECGALECGALECGALECGALECGALECGAPRRSFACCIHVVYWNASPIRRLNSARACCILLVPAGADRRVGAAARWWSRSGTTNRTATSATRPGAFC